MMSKTMRPQPEGSSASKPRTYYFDPEVNLKVYTAEEQGRVETYAFLLDRMLKQKSEDRVVMQRRSSEAKGTPFERRGKDRRDSSPVQGGWSM